MLDGIKRWFSIHWKIFSVAVPMILAGGGSLAGYVSSVDGRLDALEEYDRSRASDVDRTLMEIKIDVSETRCMVILMNTGGNPLECINDR